MLLTTVGDRTAAAATPEAEQQARRMFESAEEHFRNGLFAEALAEYQAGYDIAPLPGFLINIAQCQRRMGRLAVAKATYRKFIMVAPDSPFVPQVKALIVELDALTQDLAGTPEESQSKAETASSNEGGQVTAEGQAPTTSGQNSAELTAVPPTPVVQPPSKTRWWLWGLIGAAAAGAVTTVVLVAMPPGNKTLHDGSVGTLRR
jgi:hypothetical protein